MLLASRITKSRMTWAKLAAYGEEEHTKFLGKPKEKRPLG
jgi:hypothetical protein